MPWLANSLSCHPNSAFWVGCPPGRKQEGGEWGHPDPHVAPHHVWPRNMLVQRFFLLSSTALRHCTASSRAASAAWFAGLTRLEYNCHKDIYIARQPHQWQSERGEHGSPMYNRSQPTAAAFASCWHFHGSQMQTDVNISDMRGRITRWLFLPQPARRLRGTPVRVHRASRRPGPAPEHHLSIQYNLWLWRRAHACWTYVLSMIFVDARASGVFKNQAAGGYDASRAIVAHNASHLGYPRVSIPTLHSSWKSQGAIRKFS